MEKPKCNPIIPTHEIKWKMGRVHCGKSARNVIAIFYAAMKNNPEWTRKLRKQAYRYALWCHKENQNLYDFVMK